MLRALAGTRSKLVAGAPSGVALWRRSMAAMSKALPDVRKGASRSSADTQQTAASSPFAPAAAPAGRAPSRACLSNLLPGTLFVAGASQFGDRVLSTAQGPTQGAAARYRRCWCCMPPPASQPALALPALPTACAPALTASSPACLSHDLVPQQLSRQLPRPAPLPGGSRAHRHPGRRI